MEQMVKTVVTTLKMFIKLFGFEMPETLKTADGQPVILADESMERVREEGESPNPLEPEAVYIYRIQGEDFFFSLNQAREMRERFGGRYFTLKQSLAYAKRLADEKASLLDPFQQILTGDFSGKGIYTQEEIAKMTPEQFLKCQVTGYEKHDKDKVAQWAQSTSTFVERVIDFIREDVVMPRTLNADIRDIHSSIKSEGGQLPFISAVALQFIVNGAEGEKPSYYYVVIDGVSSSEVFNELKKCDDFFVAMKPLHYILSSAKGFPLTVANLNGLQEERNIAKLALDSFAVQKHDRRKKGIASFGRTLGDQMITK